MFRNFVVVGIVGRSRRSEEENLGEKREIPMGKMIYCEIFEKKVEKSLEVIKNCVSLQSV